MNTARGYVVGRYRPLYFVATAAAPTNALHECFKADLFLFSGQCRNSGTADTESNFSLNGTFGLDNTVGLDGTVGGNGIVEFDGTVKADDTVELFGMDEVDGKVGINGAAAKNGTVPLSLALQQI